MYFSLGDVSCARKLFDERITSDLVTWNSMIDGYIKYGFIYLAREMFDEMPERDIISCNSMLNGYVKNGLIDLARDLFDTMHERDTVSWNIMISGYGKIGDMKNAGDLFDKMSKRDIVSWNSMLDGYAKIGDVPACRTLFHAMPKKNSVSWNVMLALYTRTKQYGECLRLFDSLMSAGNPRPTDAIFVSVLTACANLGDLERGKAVHSLVRERCRFIERDVLLSTALLTMYTKGGAVGPAREIFDSMHERSVATWNSMIMGYGLHGQGKAALRLFVEMEKKGVRPNKTTFVCVLSSCAHGGMVLEGWWCFYRMIQVHRIVPKPEHICCLMDILGRAGLVSGLEEITKNGLLGDVSKSRGFRGALISSFRNNSDWRLGEHVGKKLIEIDPSDIGAYIFLSNIYARENRWDEVEKVRERMKENGLIKIAGSSLVVRESDSIRENRVVLSMLSEMGTQLKISCRD